MEKLEHIGQTIKKSAIGKRIFECTNCRNEVGVWPLDQKRYQNHFCNKQCLSKWMAKRPKLYGKENPSWKGNNLKYGGIHRRIKNELEKPKLCQSCNKIPPRDLANISQEYKLEKSDWEWLCRRCHMTKDGRMKILINENSKRKTKIAQLTIKGELVKIWDSQLEIVKTMQINPGSLGRCLRGLIFKAKGFKWQYAKN